MILTLACMISMMLVRASENNVIPMEKPIPAPLTPHCSLHLILIYSRLVFLFILPHPLISFLTPTLTSTPAMSVTTKASIASFGGKLLKLSHAATSTRCEMNFNLYLPPQATGSTAQKVPVLIYLSGLTCTADNCSEKGFFQHGASRRGIAVLYPDTSPRMPAPSKYTHPHT